MRHLADSRRTVRLKVSAMGASTKCVIRASSYHLNIACIFWTLSQAGIDEYTFRRPLFHADPPRNDRFRSVKNDKENAATAKMPIPVPFALERHRTVSIFEPCRFRFVLVWKETCFVLRCSVLRHVENGQGAKWTRHGKDS